MEQDTQTEGERRVRVDFNVENDSNVNDIKVASAKLIDLINSQPGDGRLKALALTSIEEGAMWGVKAVTG